MDSTSSDWFWPLVFGLCIAAVIAVVVVLRNSARGRALSQFAAKRGLRYTKRDDTLTAQYAGGMYAVHVVEGEKGGRRFVVFDSERSEETDEGSTSKPVTVVALRVGRRLPSLRCEMHKRALFGGAAKGFRTGDQDFDKRFTVTTADAAFASAVLTPSVRAILLKEKCHQFVCHNDSVTLITSGRYPLKGFDAAIERAERVVAEVPADAWQRLPATD